MFRFAVFALFVAVAGAVSLKSCGKNNLVDVKKLSINPSTIVFPGKLNIDAAAIVNKEIKGRVDVQVTLKKKVLFAWVKIPCISNVGSCLYRDICSELKKFTCPPEMIAQNIQCQCPFKPGPVSFNMDGIDLPTIPTGFGSFVNGQYRAKAVIRADGKEIGCLEAEVKLKS
ncbi:ganglioside GM2 activator-like [Tubulanus polymorphus]|uniref:ganglioside GM2 activator-like n=1 Tax=Tubulanus polymorphus TaxID=672921 RepID=UPI003DA606C4